MTSSRARTVLLAAVSALVLAVMAAAGPLSPSGATAATHPAAAHAADAQQCPEPYSATRDPSNPLALPAAPGADPLNGARFFVPGPAKGAAASMIAQLVGLNPKRIPVSESWARFYERLTHGRIAAELAHNHGLAHRVAELAKIAGQPEAQRLSIYSEGGGPGAIFGQAEKIFCHNLTADRGSIPVFNTYFMHPALGGCPTAADIAAERPTFERQVNEMAAATDRRPAVFLLELDALGS
ncbi:MAG: hypothetical protein WBQ18_15715, partial [Solirubrobacteraceae bacterium]